MENLKKDYDKVKDIIMSCNNTTQLKVADKVLNKLIQKHKENIPPKQINILKQLIKLMNIKCTKGKSEDMNEISEIGKEFRDTLNKSNTPELKKVAATIEEEINIGTQIEQNHLPYEEAIKLASTNVDNISDYYTNPNYCIIAVENKNGDKKTLRVEKDLYEKSKTEKNVLIMDDMEISHQIAEDDIDEATGASSSGAFVAPINQRPIVRTFKKGDIPVSVNGLNKPIGKMMSMGVLEEEEEIEEAVDYGGAVGAYVTPAMWAKNKSEWRGAHVPTYKGGKFVNIKEKCSKYPYCDQGSGGPSGSPITITNTSDMKIDNVFNENKIIKKSNLKLKK